MSEKWDYREAEKRAHDSLDAGWLDCAIRTFPPFDDPLDEDNEVKQLSYAERKFLDQEVAAALRWPFSSD